MLVLEIETCGTESALRMAGRNGRGTGIVRSDTIPSLSLVMQPSFLPGPGQASRKRSIFLISTVATPAHESPSYRRGGTPIQRERRFLPNSLLVSRLLRPRATTLRAYAASVAIAWKEAAVSPHGQNSESPQSYAIDSRDSSSTELAVLERIDPSASQVSLSSKAKPWRQCSQPLQSVLGDRHSNSGATVH